MKIRARRTLLVILFTTITTKILSQGIYVMEGKLLDKYEPIIYTLSYDDIEGSPYLNDTLKNGVVKFIGGDIIRTLLRYNIYEDGVEYVEGEKLLEIDNSDQLQYIQIGDDQLVYVEYSHEQRTMKGYLIEEVSGKCRLFKKYSIDFEDAEAPLTSYHGPKPARFVLKPPEWFTSNNGGPISNLKTTKSSLKNLFGDHYTTMEAYKKREKLKLHKGQDMILFFEYYNSID